MSLKVSVVKVGAPLGRYGAMYQVSWTDSAGQFNKVSLRGYGNAHSYAKLIRRKAREQASDSLNVRQTHGTVDPAAPLPPAECAQCGEEMGTLVRGADGAFRCVACAYAR